MAITKDDILGALAKLDLPDGGNLVSRDMIRALGVDAVFCDYPERGLQA